MKNEVINWFKLHHLDIYEEMNIVSHNHSNGDLHPYHAEGSIWNHTEMVIKESKNDINLLFAALLHDIGKIETRIEKKNGKVSFFGHENISMVKSLDILKNAKEYFNIDILLIIKLIAWHGELWMKNGNDKTEQINKINNKFANNDFYYTLLEFVRADAFGRTYLYENDVNKTLDEFEFLENFVPVDLSLYNKHKPKKEVICLIGLSGSGKSTFIRDNSKYKDYKIVSVDKYLDSGKLDYNSVDYNKKIKKAHDLTLKDLNEYVENEENIIIDMTNLTKETRRKKLSKIPSSKYLKIGVVFLVGLNDIFINLKKRNGKNLSKEIILKQALSFELPGLDEFHRIDYNGIYV